MHSFSSVYSIFIIDVKFIFFNLHTDFSVTNPDLIFFTAIVKFLFTKWRMENEPHLEMDLPESLCGPGKTGIRTRIRGRVKHFFEERRKQIRTLLGIGTPFFHAYTKKVVSTRTNDSGKEVSVTAAEEYEVCVLIKDYFIVFKFISIIHQYIR